MVGVALTQEVFHWEQALGFQKPMPSSVLVCLLPIDEDELSATAPASGLPACCHAPHHDDNGLSH